MIQARITDDFPDVIKTVAALVEHAGEVRGAPRLLEHIERIMRDASYRFVIADNGHGGAVAAAGVVTFFFQPMAEVHVLAVEALWFRDDSLDAQLPVWRGLVQLATKMKFGGVCVTAQSTNATAALRQLIECGSLDGHPVTTATLPLQKQGNSQAVWSALAGKPITDSVFFSVPAVLVHTQKVTIDLSGREYSGSQPLYRGEGRLECAPHWECADLDALAAVHFSRGFYARPRTLPAGSTKEFEGTIAEQLLHQGYVAQGAVSLSTSFDVAANYATHAGRRTEALVFTVDTDRLRQRTKIFDASATLQAACPWIPMNAWTPLRRVVGALWGDLPAAGRFLERCYEECFKRARAGLGSLAPRPDVHSYLSSEARSALDAAGISHEELMRVHDVFEEFAELAVQRVGSVDELRGDGLGGYTVETHRVGPMAYFEVFARIRDALLESRPDADPGWDTTPLGYLAKTARDEECFAAGCLSGDLIVEAWVVDHNRRRGRPINCRR